MTTASKQKTSMPKLSMLDLVAVREGQTSSDAIATAVRTAQHAEGLGFQRYWLAEHHNMAGLACSSTAVLVGHIAQQTQTIRVGSGGIMLPNHAPLIVAEAFGTLASLYPNRIDLGLGRAPGTDGPTMRAMRRDRAESEEDFPREVAELQAYLGNATEGQRVHAYPGEGTQVPIWLLGSSLFSAQLAGQMGLPYAFASHFAPAYLMQALHVYRSSFKPSAALDKPYCAMGVPLIAAPTNEEAELLASSVQQRVLGILTNRRGKLQSPVAGFMQGLDPRYKDAINDFLACGLIGDEITVVDGFKRLYEATQVDEFVVVCDVFDPALRLRALDIAAQAITTLNHHAIPSPY